jgi:Yip1 domain
MPTMKCPKCNQPISGNSRFCGSCGQRIDNAAGETPAPALVAAAFPAAAMAGGAAAPGAAAPGAAAPGAAAAGPATGTAPWLQRLIERVKNIVLSPRSEWPVIAPESTSTAELYTGYVMPLAALAAAMSFVRMAIIGMHVPFAGVTRMPMTSGLSYAILSFAFGLVGLFLVGLIINGLAPTFGGSSDRRQALKVAAYSFTPAWLSSVLALSPILPTLLQWVALFYGIYVLYLGLPVLMRSPPERALGYTATVVLCTLLLGVVFMVLSIGAGRFGWGPGARDSTAASRAAARDQGATAVGNIIGNALGTDDKGKAGLTAALSNLAKAGEQSESQATSSAAAANAPAAGAQSPLSAAGGLVTALGGALGGSHRVDVVDFKTLTAMLPSSLPNMKRTAAQGENQGAVGVKTSSAKATYQGDDGASIHIEISDLSGVSGLMDMAGALVQNTTSESDSGYERDKVIGGRSVHEKYDANAKKSDISVMLAKRFEVDVAGQGVDMSAVEQSLSQVDLARLESMKDQGAQPQ